MPTAVVQALRWWSFNKIIREVFAQVFGVMLKVLMAFSQQP